MLREAFSASHGTLGAVFTAAMLAYGLLSLPTWLILNRVSPLLVVRLVLVGGAAACLAVALAGTFFAVQWWLLAFLAVTSFVHSTTQPMDNTFTGRYTSLGHRSLGYGTSFALSFGVGSFAAVCAVALTVLARRLRRRSAPDA